MDESRLKNLCQKILDMSYSGVTISEFRALPTQKFDEDSGEWVPHSFSLFVMLKRPTMSYESQSYRDVGDFLESLLGFETCVDFV